MNDLVSSGLLSNRGNLGLGTIMLTLIAALALAAVVFFTYKISFSGVMYNRKFNISLVMLTLVTTVVMLVIGNDLALSLGMVGALSIVRFRTAIKDPRDTGFIFWVIAIGLSVGSQNYLIAFIGSIVISLVLVGFNVKGVGRDDRFILIIRGLRSRESEIGKCVFNSFKNCELRGKNSNGDNIEIIYQVKLYKHDDKNILADLYNIEGVTAVNMIAQNGETIG